MASSTMIISLYLRTHSSFHRVKKMRCQRPQLDSNRSNPVNPIQMSQSGIFEGSQYRSNSDNQNNRWQMKQEILIKKNSLNDLMVEAIIQCQFCLKYFNKKSHMYRHLREQHSSRGLKTFRCPYQSCIKQFKRGSHLKRHIISHTHTKSYKCGLCIMAFGYKHHLDRHIKLVHLKQPFKCEKCAAQFTKKRSLNKHFRKHQETKNALISQANSNSHGKTHKKRNKSGVKTKLIQKSQKPTKACEIDQEKPMQSDNKSSLYFSENGEDSSKSDNQQIRDNGVMMRISESQIATEKEGENNQEIYQCIEDNCNAAFFKWSAFKRHSQNVHRRKKNLQNSQIPCV